MSQTRAVRVALPAADAPQAEQWEYVALRRAAEAGRKGEAPGAARHWAADAPQAERREPAARRRAPEAERKEQVPGAARYRVADAAQELRAARDNGTPALQILGNPVAPRRPAAADDTGDGPHRPCKARRGGDRRHVSTPD